MPSSPSDLSNIPVSVPVCARILGVHPTTLRRAAREAAERRPFSSDREDVIRCAKVFARADSPVRREAPLGEIARASGISEDICAAVAVETKGRAGPPPSRSRPALTKSEEASWPRMPTPRLIERMRDAWIDMETRDSINKRRRIAGIGAELARRGVSTIDDFIDWTKVRLFLGSLADWLSSGDPRSRVLFLVGPNSPRPVHPRAASGSLPRGAKSVALLSLGEYCSALSEAVALEIAEAEARELEEVASRGSETREGTQKGP